MLALVVNEHLPSSWFGHLAQIKTTTEFDERREAKSVVPGRARQLISSLPSVEAKEESSTTSDPQQTAAALATQQVRQQKPAVLGTPQVRQQKPAVLGTQQVVRRNMPRRTEKHRKTKTKVTLIAREESTIWAPSSITTLASSSTLGLVQKEL